MDVFGWVVCSGAFWGAFYRFLTEDSEVLPAEMVAGLLFCALLCMFLAFEAAAEPPYDDDDRATLLAKKVVRKVRRKAGRR